MTRIFVCPQMQLEETLLKSGARHMIALTGPEKKPVRPPQISGEYLHLRFNDITEPRPGFIAPSADDASAILTFVDRWDRSTPLLIQCWMGISRSTAAALIGLARIRPPRDVSALAAELRAAAPEATPNALLIAHGDRHLGFNGRLIEAVRAIGRGAEASTGSPFSLPVETP